MTSNELNEYIRHYLEEDKTHSAIMMTADWGTGKSYYIQTELVPFLDQPGKRRCIVVSLYGLKDVAEISKRIFSELWLKSLLEKKGLKWTKKISKHKMLTGSGTAIFSVIMQNYSLSDENLLSVYESVNLSDKLIVLEDIERSEIDIVQLLGYVNNLVEQDNVKVLLVANEKELMKHIPIDPKVEAASEQSPWKGNEDTKSQDYTEATKEYFRIKEKTISDTISFTGDDNSAIKNIIKEFGNEQLNYFCDKQYVDEIRSLFLSCGISNLRSFIFACQKTIDIYKKIDKNLLKDNVFIKCIFYGNILFSLRLKAGKKTEWDGTPNLSFSLGTYQFPVFRFCYDYILDQKFDKEKVEKTHAEYADFRLYDESKSDTDPALNKLRAFKLYPEKEVIALLYQIEKRLENENDIAFEKYAEIIRHIVEIEKILDFDGTQCIDNMANNLQGKSLALYHALEQNLTITRDMIANTVDQQKYQKLAKRLLMAFENASDKLGYFRYSAGQMDQFSSDICKNSEYILHDKIFAERFDMAQLSCALFQCTPHQMYNFRIAFQCLYNRHNIVDLLPDDKESLQQLHSELKTIPSTYNLDKIQIYQIQCICDDLQQYIHFYESGIRG